MFVETPLSWSPGCAVFGLLGLGQLLTDTKGTCRHTYTHRVSYIPTTYLSTIVPTHVRAYTHIKTYIHAYIHTYINIYLHTYVHMYVHTYLHTYTYIHTYIHRYLHVVRLNPHHESVYLILYLLKTSCHMSTRVYLPKKRVDGEVLHSGVQSCEGLSLASETGTKHRTRSMHIMLSCCMSPLSSEFIYSLS